MEKCYQIYRAGKSLGGHSRCLLSGMFNYFHINTTVLRCWWIVYPFNQNITVLKVSLKVSILGLYPTILHTLRMGGWPPQHQAPHLDWGWQALHWRPGGESLILRKNVWERGVEIGTGLQTEGDICLLDQPGKAHSSPSDPSLGWLQRPRLSPHLFAPLSSVWVPAHPTMSSLRTPFPHEMFLWARSLESTGLGVWCPTGAQNMFTILWVMIRLKTAWSQDKLR